MRHLETLRGLWATVSDAPKDLITRASGRLYTPEAVGRQLVNDVVTALHTSRMSRLKLRLIDPFGGDGRLVCWLVEELSRRHGSSNVQADLFCWDVDERAIRDASTRVRQAIDRLGISASLDV